MRIDGTRAPASHNDTDVLALLQKGPMAVSIDSSPYEGYSGGIISCSASPPYHHVDHANALVGYGIQVRAACVRVCSVRACVRRGCMCAAYVRRACVWRACVRVQDGCTAPSSALSTCLGAARPLRGATHQRVVCHLLRDRMDWELEILEAAVRRHNGRVLC